MTRPDHPPPVSAQSLDYQAPPPRRSSTLVIVLFVSAVVLVLLAAGFLIVRTTAVTSRAVGSVQILPPTIPAPGPRQMRQTPLPPGGVTLTVKQRGAAWLPGGNLKLSVDDVTGGQVLVSVAAGDGTVVFGPKSVREREAYDFADTDGAPLRLEVLRLRNFLTGDDFGEFRISGPAGATRPAMTEAQKIEALLGRVAALNGATFIRNGDAHTAAEAVEHLRAKWTRAGGPDDPSATAERFIESVATKSSLSGTPYRIRLPAGREVESAAWFSEQLREIEGE